MKKVSMLFVVFASVMLFAGMAFAEQTYTYPAETPVLSVAFPDDWSVELDAEDARGVYAMSPDEAIEFDIWPLDEEEVGEDLDAALKAEVGAIDEVIAQYVTELQAGKTEELEVNGIKFIKVSGTGKDKEDGTDVTVSVGFFSPDGETLFSFIYWGTPDADTKYADQLAAIEKSFKKP